MIKSSNLIKYIWQSIKYLDPIVHRSEIITRTQIRNKRMEIIKIMRIISGFIQQIELLRSPEMMTKFKQKTNKRFTKMNS